MRVIQKNAQRRAAPFWVSIAGSAVSVLMPV